MGSWLNIAEIELSIVARQCLYQRIGSLRRLRTLSTAWLAHRKRSPIRWRFTTKHPGSSSAGFTQPFKREATLGGAQFIGDKP